MSVTARGRLKARMIDYDGLFECHHLGPVDLDLVHAACKEQGTTPTFEIATIASKYATTDATYVLCKQFLLDYTNAVWEMEMFNNDNPVHRY